MDGFAFGTILGLQDSVNNAVRNLNEADGIIADKNGKIRALKHDLCLWQAEAAGRTALANLYKDALKKADPNNPLLKATGRTFVKSGIAEIVGRAHFDKAFDAKCLELGISDPQSIREKAV